MARPPVDPDYGLTDPMKKSLSKNMVDLVSNLMNIKEIIDYLVQEDVILDAEDVMCKPKRKEQVRKLVDMVQKRPSRDYWKFIISLYLPSTRQGHIAEKILQKLQMFGGTIRGDVRQLREQYQDHWRQEERRRQQGQPMEIEGEQLQHPQHAAPPVAPPRQLPGNLSSDFNVRPPVRPRVARTSVPETTVPDGSRSVAGHPVTGDSMGSGGVGVQGPSGTPDAMETDAESRGNFGASGDGGAGGGDADQNQYEVRKGRGDDLYTMERRSRGRALIINNHNFTPLTDRDGTNEDCEKLHDLFKHFLGFDPVVIRPDLTGQGMRRELEEFASRIPADCESCMVAILTHGYRGGVLFGTDGRLDYSGQAVQGTFITTDELKYIFSKTKCRALSDKPKMMIIQACKGTLDDTTRGHRTLATDVAVEPDLSSNIVHHDERDGPDLADIVFLDATVDNYVAYRNLFIGILDDVFRRHVRSDHILELQTKINAQMSQEKLSGHIFTISEGKHTLRKKWYLNPPPSFNR